MSKRHPPRRLVRMTRKEALMRFVVGVNQLFGRSDVAVRLLERDNVGVEHNVPKLFFPSDSM